MQTIHVARDFDADADTVFDVISDHAGYTRLPGVRQAYLRQDGDPQRNGVGAERVIRLPAMTLVERITEYSPGKALAYRIIEWPLPATHLGARMLLQPLGNDGARTRVHWSSRVRGRSPIARDLVAGIVSRQMAIAYAIALRTWAGRLRRA